MQRDTAGPSLPGKASTAAALQPQRTVPIASLYALVLLLGRGPAQGTAGLDSSARAPNQERITDKGETETVLGVHAVILRWPTLTGLH